MRRVVVAAFVVAAAAVVGLTAPAGAEDKNAVMVDNAYRTGDCASNSGTGNFEINTGDSITWKNCGMNVHTVTGSFGDSGDLAHDATYEFTFTQAGTFAYNCKYHRFSGMTGTVTVSAGATTTTTTSEVTIPTTTATTVRATTTSRPPSTTTTAAATTSTSEFPSVFDPDATPSTTEATIFSTGTTRALGSGGDDDTSAGLVALLIVGLGAVGTAGALLIRRMRGGPGEPI